MEHRYRSIFENATQGIFQTSVDGRYLSVNPALARIYGYLSPEDLILSISDIRSQLYVDPTRRAQFKAEMDANGAVEEFVSEIVRKDGSHIWIREDAHVVRGPGGEILYYEGWVEDVTDRLRHEAELLKAKAAAEDASRAKTEFLATMSHELRTPLNGILGMTEILLGTRIDYDQKDCIQTLQSSAGTLLALVNDILDFSKIEAGKLNLEEAPVDLEEVVDDCLRPLAPMAAQKKLALHVDWGEGVPARVRGDSLRLRQCLSNLVNNAVKFTSTGAIYVRIRKAGEEDGRACIRFEVEDSGIGVEPEIAARLFQPFSQGDASTTRRFGGTGLGLAIVQRLVAMMEGEAGLRSVPGHGSLFHFHVLVKVLSGPPETSGASVLIVAPDLKTGAGWSTCFRRAGATIAGVITPSSFKLDSMDAQFVLAANGMELPETPVSVLRVGDLGTVSRGQLSSPLRIAELRRALTEKQKPAAAQFDVLIANENPIEQKVLSVQLSRLGLSSRVMADPSALGTLGENNLVLLDCDLRGLDVYAWIAERRDRERSGLGRRIRIIGLTEPNSNQAERCRAAGADACLPKPVHPQKLTALLRAEQIL